jgi:aminopeptidase N
MRPFALSLFVSLGLGLPAQIVHDKCMLEDLARSEALPYATLLKAGEDGDSGYDLYYLRCDWQIDPSVRAISGSVAAHFTAVHALDTVWLDLSDSMQVSMVMRNGEPLNWEHDEDRLGIALPNMLSPGQSDSLTVYYAGEPATSGFGSFNIGTHADAPILWTLSQPYGARDWWPCKQHLGDKVDSLDLWVTVPNGNRVASNGKLLGAEELGSAIRYHWRHNYPIAYYLIALAVTNYAAYTDTVHLTDGPVEILNYVYPESLVEWQAGTAEVVQQMVLFDSLFGAYPFAQEKYGHAQFNWGGGMEHQTMTFQGPVNYEIFAHELAHQWFGNKVTCASWEDLWLNEGFASYLSGLCYEAFSELYWEGFKTGRIAFITSQPNGSVRVTDTTDTGRLFNGRLTYAKGAFVLHMLRWVCGDEAFFSGVRNYLNDPALAYGTARTADLQTHLESTSGLDLSGFMQDWFVGEGHPIYSVRWAQDVDGNTSIRLGQRSSHASVGFFEMPVPVRLSGEGGDTVLVLDHSYDGQVFTFALPFEANTLVFDPDHWIITEPALVQAVPAALLSDDQLLLYPNPAGEEAWLYLANTWQGPLQVQLLDAAGREVHRTSFASPPQQFSIALRQQPAGSYTLLLQGPTRTLRIPLYHY